MLVCVFKSRLCSCTSVCLFLVLKDYLYSFVFNSKLSCITAVFPCFATKLLFYWLSVIYKSCDSVVYVHSSLVFHLAS